MKYLDPILAAGKLVETEDVKNIFKASGYKIKSVEKWLYVNEVKAVIECVQLERELARENISNEEYEKLIEDNRIKRDNINTVFRAYCEFFNVNVWFKDFFDSYMNPAYGKVSDKIYKEVYGF